MGLTMQSERPAHRMSEQWHPLGPVGVITAFNFPVAVWAWNAFLAAIAGDTIIWKPSPKAPLCAIAVQQICNRVMHQQGYQGIFSLFVTDQSSLAGTMVQDPRLPLISFTGSVAVGRQIASTVGSRLGRALLELSGNNAVIIDEYRGPRSGPARHSLRSRGHRRPALHNNQTPARPPSRYEEVTAKLVNAYAHIHIGNPLEPGVLMGPLIDQNAVETYRAAIEDIKKEGGEFSAAGMC